MGIIKWIIVVIAVSFVGVTVMGWDSFLELVGAIGIKFQEFVIGGFEELQERVI